MPFVSMSLHLSASSPCPSWVWELHGPTHQLFLLPKQRERGMGLRSMTKISEGSTPLCLLSSFFFFFLFRLFMFFSLDNIEGMKLLLRGNTKTLIHLAERWGTVSSVIKTPKIMHLPSTKKCFSAKDWWGCCSWKVNLLWMIIFCDITWPVDMFALWLSDCAS